MFSGTQPSHYMFNTPILFLVFNRPDTTEIVFQKIREIKPRQLFVAADGWRVNKAGEKEKCEETRAIVMRSIDWDCEVKTLFRDENLGCGKSVSSAISWFFENVEEGIILEDDCVPDNSFFPYCEELLYRYRSEEKVMHISGSNFQISEVSDESYYFSNSCYMWGWATWRRAWKLYDFKMEHFNKRFDLSDYLFSKDEKVYWKRVFSNVKSGRVDTWDYQWYFTCWYNKGLSIVPQYNLVKNIGFRPDATHTQTMGLMSNLKVFPINAIKHPEVIQRNVKADYWQGRIIKLYAGEYELFYKHLKIFYMRLKQYSLVKLLIRKLNIRPSEKFD